MRISIGVLLLAILGGCTFVRDVGETEDAGPDGGTRLDGGSRLDGGPYGFFKVEDRAPTFAATDGIAMFMNNPNWGSLQQVGPCLVFTSTVPTASPWQEALYFNSPACILQNAGELSATSGLLSLQMSPYDAGSKTHYNGALSPELFSEGQQVSFAADGGAVPAFGPIQLVAPSRVTVTQPSKPSSTLLVDRSTDFSVAWTGAGFGTTEVDLWGNSGIGISCSFPSSAGSGAIPAAALQALTAGDGGLFRVYAYSTATSLTGGWELEMRATNQGVWTDQTQADTSQVTVR